MTTAGGRPAASEDAQAGTVTAPVRSTAAPAHTRGDDLVRAPLLESGVDAEVLNTLPFTSRAGESIGVRRTIAGGDMIVSVTKVDEDHPLRLDQAKVGIRSVETGRIRYLSRGIGRQGNQLTGADHRGRWTAWVETPSTNLAYNPWTLWVHDDATGATRKIASYPEVGAPRVPRATGDTIPTILGARVYVGAVSAVKDGKPVTSVYSTRLDGRGDLRLDHRDEFLPQASADRLITAHDESERWELRARRIGRPRPTVVASGTSDVSLARAAEGVIAWVTTSRGTSHLHVQEDEGPARVLASTRKTVYYSNVTGDYVHLTAGARSFAVNVDTGAIRRLAPTSVVVASANHGPFVAWNVAGRDGRAESTVVSRLLF